MRFESVIDTIGNTPAVQFKTDEIEGARIYVKLEGFNPSGSVKDRACISNIKGAIASGKLKEGMTIVDASSGNMACAIAYYGRILGYDTHVVCGSKLTEDKKRFIEYFGATLEMCGDYTIEANHYCRDKIVPTSDKYCFLDQLHNFDNPKGAYDTLGPEILTDFPEITALIGSLGSGGSMTGSTRYLKEQNPNIKAFTVEADSGTKIPGTGAFVDGDYVTPFIAKAYEDNLFDGSNRVTIEQAMARTRQLADQGFFVGFQTGGVLEGAIRTIKEHGLKGDIVMISGDSGWKNVDKLMG